MKNFLITFIMILIILIVFFFFGGFLLLDFSQNFWLAVFFTALIVSFCIHQFVRLAIRVEELENKIKDLENIQKDA